MPMTTWNVVDKQPDSNPHGPSGLTDVTSIGAYNFTI